MESTENRVGRGTWARYKLAQAQFTSWVKQTADKVVSRKQNGTTPEVQTEVVETTPAPGKESRRQKKARAKATVTPLADPRLETNIESAKSVHWTELEVLALKIAQNAEPEQIPDAAVNILRDVVNLRKKSFKFFSGAAAKRPADRKLQESNQTHAHIINVLERILAKFEALTSARRKVTKNEKPDEKNPMGLSDLINMFTHLEVQTSPDAAEDDNQGDPPSEDDQKSTRSKKSHKSKKKKPRKERHSETKVSPRPSTTDNNDDTSWLDTFDWGLPSADEDDEDDEFDFYMMVYCFFEDFNTIRNYVQERWCDYWYDRSVHLNTLAVITNAAFELFHMLEWDLMKALKFHPELTQYTFMMDMLFIQIGIEHIDYDSYDGLSQEEHDERLWRDEADWLGFLSYCTIYRTLKNVPPGKVPMLPPSARKKVVYGAHNMKTWQDFENTISFQMITEGSLLKALKKNGQVPPKLPAEPLLLLDWQEALKRHAITSSLIFSFHLWVDIRHIMEEEVINPFNEMQKTGQRVVDALRLHDPNSVSKDKAFKWEYRERIQDTTEFLLEDFTYEDKLLRFRQIGIAEDPEEFFLLKNEPVWAGLLDFRARLVHSEMGHQFAAFTYVLEAAAYLYHAARAADPTLPVWDNMFKLNETYLDDSIFKSGFLGVKDPVAIIHNYQLAIKPPVGWDGPPDLASRSGFAQSVKIRRTLYYRYGFAEEDSYNEIAYMEHLAMHRLQLERYRGTPRTLVGSTRESNGLLDGEGVNGTTTGAYSVAPPKLDEKSEEYLRRKAVLSKLSPIEMLQLVGDSVQTLLEGLLQLDYLQLFDEATLFLEEVMDTFGPEMQQRVNYKGGEDHPPARLDKLPTYLGEDLKAVAEAGNGKESEIISKLVDGCREFLEQMQSATSSDTSAATEEVCSQ
ncbi:hypothetical protein NEUTE1DRAFT_147820 [Neurospora tetrasperma FGSC 2508]|uniref:DUF6604 domain-containing protein n=1 Tax=Neurospora tetrasperma (strain FGSC 2508 / ATCC MYA-4615 / P0657) TaxID=510951 RepID=F8MTC8_NEUT8|nr:uncharacterized protein NEUTE1DRAFT_147820 [Neurospora tetrasperma FGSC 2508]EGO55260.1 hypothetical protein NEUTE1DRAFT_147820 [Neurospora tetrasperma FGSC 2508]EGZ69521.1 hypothetical protein NEUTE2DRAFT_159968 [Neurospora tetrasperma FGSC 2509]